MSKPATICTCEWSRVNTQTEDPPYIVRVDPYCKRHGERHVLEALAREDRLDDEEEERGDYR